MLRSAKLCNVTSLPSPKGVRLEWYWVATTSQGGPQVLQRQTPGYTRRQEGQYQPLTIYSTASRCQHELPFASSTPHVAFPRADKSLLLVALTASTYKLSGCNTLELSWYMMDLGTGICKPQALATSYWPAWWPHDGGRCEFYHSHAQRILSFANASTFILTDADDLKKVLRFDISPFQVNFSWSESVRWSDDGSMVVVRAICSSDMPFQDINKFNPCV